MKQNRPPCLFEFGFFSGTKAETTSLFTTQIPVRSSLKGSSGLNPKPGLHLFFEETRIKALGNSVRPSEVAGLLVYLKPEVLHMSTIHNTKETSGLHSL